MIDALSIILAITIVFILLYKAYKVIILKLDNKLYWQTNTGKFILKPGINFKIYKCYLFYINSIVNALIVLSQLYIRISPPAWRIWLFIVFILTISILSITCRQLLLLIYTNYVTFN